MTGMRRPPPAGPSGGSSRSDTQAKRRDSKSSTEGGGRHQTRAANIPALIPPRSCVNAENWRRLLDPELGFLALALLDVRILDRYAEWLHTSDFNCAVLEAVFWCLTWHAGSSAEELLSLRGLVDTLIGLKLASRDDAVAVALDLTNALAVWEPRDASLLLRLILCNRSQPRVCG